MEEIDRLWRNLIAGRLRAGDFLEEVSLTWRAEVQSGTVLLAALLAGWLVFAGLSWLASRAAKKSKPGGRWLIIARRIRGPLRLAFMIAALGFAAPLIASNTDVAALAQRLASIAVIGLCGWTVAAVVNAYVDLAERRHRIDVEDNLLARKHHTQFQVIRRAGMLLIGLITIAAMLMTFPAVRNYGVSLFASAGVAGIVIGIAARPILANLIAGLQIALTQPIRVEDAVVLEGEWGWIEEITATYVVVRIWDWRRLVVPLSYFIEQPFQNWTRETATILGSVFWHVDYTAPIDRIREKLQEVAENSELWDRRVVVLQVVDATPETLELRALVSARNSPTAWDLRCEVREKVAAWLQAEYPEALPKTRATIQRSSQDGPSQWPLSEDEVERMPRGPERSNPAGPEADKGDRRS